MMEDQNVLSELKKKIAALELTLQEKDILIRQLQREIPGNSLKMKRLGINETLLKHSEPKDGEPYWTAPKVRDTFVSFFEAAPNLEHTNYLSSPVVPLNDPTLLFINSGMAQFKPVFLGQVDPRSPMASLKRACNTQKCIRAGGKHNDLDDVGKDSYHHTFFEMLGNWSFGDYFKVDAITMAWTLLTKVYGIPEDRLYVTYFEGDAFVPKDTEAQNLWRQFVAEDRILPGNSKDNFWEMGPTGPCGPCSEIHFDRIGGRNAAKLVNKDDPDVLEIWNLVFMQFNRKSDGSLEPLPAKHVDTGMGFERLVSVLQNKRTNYSTDVFSSIMSEIQRHVGLFEENNPSVQRSYRDKYYKDDPQNIDMAYRVLADHIRTLTVAIADGAVPSNEGRGYVLRRIIRRAVRFSQDTLKMPKNSFSQLVPAAIKSLEGAFPELKTKEKYVMDILKEEEEVFQRTLKKGVEHFEKESAKLLGNHEKMVPGELVFKLYESMGFPKDLTQIMAEEKGLKVDMAGYDECMRRHVEISKAVKKSAALAFKPFEAKETSELEEKGIHSTIQTVYEEEDVVGTVVGLYDTKVEKFVERISLTDPEAVYGVILDRTSMYYESGGQVGDEGWLKNIEAGLNSSELDTDFRLLNVQDVQNYKGFIVHIAKANLDCRVANSLSLGAQIICAVDYERRDRVKKNHTGTHMLNWGLREVLATEIDQAGSLVNDEYLRFDFTSKGPIQTEDIAKLEALLLKKIQNSEPVDTKIVPLEETKKIKSLRAVFGETYPDPVRVVAVGCKIEEVLQAPEDPKWLQYSIELCGGTHVRNSCSIKKIVVMSEEAKGKNVRRMTCLSDEKALKAWADGEEWYSIVESCSDTDIKSLSDRVSNADIPLTQRRDLLEVLNKKKVQMMEKEKERLKDILETLGEAASQYEQQGKLAQVVILENNAVAAPMVIKGLSKKVKSVSFFVVVKSEASLSVGFAIQKEHAAKLDGDALFERLKLLSDFRGGGKSTSIVCMTDDVSKFDAAVNEIRAYVDKAGI